jgi:DUF4097 and DUF4098 domain-containing protein YvlB
MRVRVFVVAAAVVASTLSASAQDRRGPEETERFSRTLTLGASGRLSLANIAGEIVVTGGGGDAVTIEALKRTRGARSELGSVRIDVQERAGRVEVRTIHSARRDRASVDYTVTVPRNALVEVSSVSGSIKVDDVRGAVRAQSISGTVTTTRSPRIELAKSVSGNVDIAGTDGDSDLSVSSVSGSVRARDVKARRLQLSSVSGHVDATDVNCDRLDMKSVSGTLEFSGALARNGHYELNSHSGSVRLTLSGSTGFELNANTFSGSIRSDLPVTLDASGSRDGRRRPGPGRATRAMFGDGSAVVNVTTFSGGIIIQKH